MTKISSQNAFEIKTTRLVLQNIKATDIANIFKGLSNPEVIKYYGVSYTSLENTKVQMQWFADIEKDKTGMWWTINSLELNTFLGAIGVYNLSETHHKAELGYWLLPEFWGKGYVKEAIGTVCDFSYTCLGLNRIEAYVESKNTASKNALLGAGFDHEAKLAEWEFKNGAYIDVDIYAKLKNKTSR